MDCLLSKVVSWFTHLVNNLVKFFSDIVIKLFGNLNLQNRQIRSKSVYAPLYFDLEQWNI